MLAHRSCAAVTAKCTSTSRVAAVCSTRHTNRPRLQPIRATEGGQPETSTSAAADAEARIEALEASIKKAKPKGGAKRQIPIRNMTPKQEQPSSNRAEWKEGQLFPEGWEQMPLGDKITELYLGQRGILFWANKAAFASAWVVGGAWVLFRFVGPALGLYKLQGDLTPPTL